MAYVFSDGCEMGAVGNAVAAPSGKWPIATGTGGTGTYTAAKGRFGTHALTLAAQYAEVILASNLATAMHTNIAVQFTTLSASPNVLWSAMDGTVQNTNTLCCLAVDTSGQISFYRGNPAATNTKLVTTAQSFPINTIIYLEIKCIANTSTGLLECRLNGDTSNLISFSGNTSQTGNNFMTRNRLGQTQGATHFSDILMFDTTGGAPNGYLGSKRIRTVFPTGDGSFLQFTPTGSASHFANVDETPPNEDTDYNASGTSTQRDSYTVAGSLPATVQNITMVNAWARARIDDANAHNYQIAARSASIDGFGPSVAAPSQYTYSNASFNTDPNTSAAWTVAGFNASEWGVKILT